MSSDSSTRSRGVRSPQEVTTPSWGTPPELPREDWITAPKLKPQQLQFVTEPSSAPPGFGCKPFFEVSRTLVDFWFFKAPPRDIPQTASGLPYASDNINTLLNSRQPEDFPHFSTFTYKSSNGFHRRIELSRKYLPHDLTTMENIENVTKVFNEFREEYMAEHGDIYNYLQLLDAAYTFALTRKVHYLCDIPFNLALRQLASWKKSEDVKLMYELETPFKYHHFDTSYATDDIRVHEHLIKMIDGKLAGYNWVMPYVSSPGSSSAAHNEELNGESVLYLEAGEPKIWMVVAQESTETFLQFMQYKGRHYLEKKWDQKSANCRRLVSSKEYLPNHHEAAFYGVKIFVIIQVPGTYVTINGSLYHWVINAGQNYAFTVNFAGFPFFWREWAAKEEHAINKEERANQQQIVAGQKRKIDGTIVTEQQTRDLRRRRMIVELVREKYGTKVADFCKCKMHSKDDSVPEIKCYKPMLEAYIGAQIEATGTMDTCLEYKLWLGELNSLEVVKELIAILTRPEPEHRTTTTPPLLEPLATVPRAREPQVTAPRPATEQTIVPRSAIPEVRLPQTIVPQVPAVVIKTEPGILTSSPSTNQPSSSETTRVGLPESVKAGLREKYIQLIIQRNPEMETIARACPNHTALKAAFNALQENPPYPFIPEVHTSIHKYQRDYESFVGCYSENPYRKGHRQRSPFSNSGSSTHSDHYEPSQGSRYYHENNPTRRHQRFMHRLPAHQMLPYNRDPRLGPRRC